MAYHKRQRRKSVRLGTVLLILFIVALAVFMIWECERSVQQADAKIQLFDEIYGGGK